MGFGVSDKVVVESGDSAAETGVILQAASRRAKIRFNSDEKEQLYPLLTQIANCTQFGTP
jgi:hypothetical protein